MNSAGRMTRNADRLAAAGALVLTLLTGCNGAAESKAPAAAARPTNLLLITLDTLRPDHIAASMPELAAFASTGAYFPYVLANGAWTYTTMSSLLAGRPMIDMGPAPWETGVRHVPDETYMLAEILSDRGYRTFYSNANDMAGESTNMLQGYDEAVFRRTMKAHASEQQAWLNAWESDGQEWPFFIHLHAMEPHAPWGAKLDPSCEASTREAAALCTARTAYDFLVEDSNAANQVVHGWNPGDAEVCGLAVKTAYACALVALDQELAETLRRFAASPAAATTLVVIATDHGETLGPWYYGHNLGSLWDLTRTFSLFAGPGIEPSVTSTPVSQADLVPTILDSLGITDALGPTGRSLLVPGDSDLRTFWCNEGGLKSHGWLAPDMSNYVRLEEALDGSREYYAVHPIVAGEENPAPEADIPAEALIALDAQSLALVDLCADGAPRGPGTPP